MIRYIFSVLLMGALFYTAALYESSALALLGFGQAFLMLFSFGYLLYEKRSLRVTIDMPVAMADQGQPILIRARAKYQYRGCYGRVRVQAAVSRVGEKSSCFRWLQTENGPAAGGQADRMREEILSDLMTAAAAGCYEIRLRQVRIYDMTGLFCISSRKVVRREKASVVVLPTIYPVSIRLSEAVRNFAGDAEVYDSLRSGNDTSEPLKLRPFQDGDKLRNIHWKLSAKTDELLVRVGSMPRGCPVVVLVEEKSGIDKGQMQCVASLSFTLMDLECPHYVAWYSRHWQDVVRIRVDDEESCYECLLYLLQEGRELHAVDVRNRYQEKYSGEPVLHHIRVWDSPGVQVDEQEIKNVKASAMERELNELELLL